MLQEAENHVQKATEAVGTIDVTKVPVQTAKKSEVIAKANTTLETKVDAVPTSIKLHTA